MRDSGSVLNLKGYGSFFEEQGGMIDLINAMNERGGEGMSYSSAGASYGGGR